MSTIYIIIAVVVLLLVIVALMYNSLVRLRNQAKEAWSDITVQLKRRADLIPNLVNTVQGYESHEKEVFEKVTEARANSVSSTNKGPKAAAAADNQIEGALKSLFAVAENYPNLKASDNFMQLQSDLTDTEDKIQASRRFYNGNVRDLNSKIQSFPSNIIAGIFGFKAMEFFEVEDQASVEEPVKVNFK